MASILQASYTGCKGCHVVVLCPDGGEHPTLQMVGLSGPGRVFTVKVQSQAQNVVLVALKPWSATSAAPVYSGRAIRQVSLPPESNRTSIPNLTEHSSFTTTECLAHIWACSTSLHEGVRLSLA